MSGEHLPELKSIYESVLNRHLKWAPPLIEEMRKGGVFVAAGADHIVREGNTSAFLRATLLEELARAGAEITFIGDPSCEEMLRRISN